MNIPAKKSRRDPAQEITNRIIAAIEKGAPPWKQPWTNAFSQMRPLRSNGAPYSGVNILILWDRACEMGFENPRWMTFRQARALGGRVKKGERSVLVVYYGSTVKTEEDEGGEAAERSFRFLKSYPVFNVEQIVGLPAHFYDYKGSDIVRTPPVSERRTFFDAIGAKIRHGGGEAFFSPGADVIRMPPFGSFDEPERYFATLAHEAIHWTGARTRLDRLKFPMSEAERAFEELIAEIGAAMLGAHLRLPPGHVDDHAAYVASWLKALRGDKRFILKAAAAAQQACDYLLERAGPDLSLDAAGAAPAAA
ncbi:ArdC family protein [Hyphococcus luteus]|uniref:Antirestriction protein n=1 Tax=Hyphococcus luteus TaxID=2058213 RepID=A0A2S7K9W9_9PROT|nr:zincin-like metallopeptidase domain-containing protein [Marinicaulis flavus]PQA89295.1 antirestriction protein [Marinicaulis flavus]